MDYRIEKKEDFKVVVMAKKFNGGNSVFDDSCPNEVPDFWDEYFSNGLEKIVSPDMGVCGETDHDTGDFWYGIGAMKEKMENIPDGFTEWNIPANTWAVFKCVGAMPDAIAVLWKRIYAEWLPQAKYEMVPSYDFENYLEGDTSSPDYVCEIWVPVKEK